MISLHTDEVHILLKNLLLVLSRPAFERAVARGKAVKRAQAQRAREAQMAEAAERKRATMQEIPHDG